MQNRIIYSDNGTLNDFSAALKRYQTGTETISSFVASSDKLFIGSRHPFNHFYVKFVTPNTNATGMTIKYWNGEEFYDTVLVDDETDGFTKNGYVTFFPDKDERWDRESTNHDSEQVTGLTSIVIYDMYWIEITFSSSFSAGVELQWVGQKFCDDFDLASEYPDLNRSVMRDAFLKDSQVSGDKTDWEEQVVVASEIITKDMIAKNLMYHPGQILDRELFRLTCVSKLAEIIYTALGDDYVDNMTMSRQEYKDRMDKSIYKLDKNENALLDVHEEVRKSGFMSR